jgi:twitching motility protein PilT
MAENGISFTLTDLLSMLIELGGSDLHIAANTQPRVRIDGKLQILEDYPILTTEQAKRLAYSIISESQLEIFEKRFELDFSFGIKGLSRFRANIFSQRGNIRSVFRAIPYEIKSFEELGLPPLLAEMGRRPNGLILVTGPTDSGKSTTLASMIDLINRERQGHIITVEDPIEFVHENKGCLVDHREVGSDTLSFAEALRRALRQDPDVVLIGEMRDLETIESALRIAETGHLTLATLHTNSAASTINRIIDVFPANQQQQIRSQLAMVLEGIVCQSLLPKASGSGRVMALEILIPTDGIRNLIREDKVHQIYAMLQTGREKHGMQTFNQSLAELYTKGLITLDVAMRRTTNAVELKDLLNRMAKTNTNSDVKKWPVSSRFIQ